MKKSSKLEFKKWMMEASTSTADVASFARPALGMVTRQWLGPWGEEDPFFRRQKKKKNKK